MGTANKCEITTTKVIYDVPSPGTFVEVDKAYHWAIKDYTAYTGNSPKFDDIIMVESHDEYIRVYWIKE